MEIGEEGSRVYRNQGNVPLLGLLDRKPISILDVGCGAGDNAALLKEMHPDCRIYGITYSSEEANIARKNLGQCFVFDIEQRIPESLAGMKFDTLIFSHVLEHLRQPDQVLAEFTKLLNDGGDVLIAVPNILSWNMRIKFILGYFEYEKTGPLDNTHLRFFTFLTAKKYLLSKVPDLEVVDYSVTGSVPLWWLRRYIFPATVSARIDRWGCKNWPNLFGVQVLIRAIKR